MPTRTRPEDAQAAGTLAAVVLPLRRRVLATIREHPVATVFVLAFAARVALAVSIFVLAGPGIFSDDVTYSQLAMERATGETAGWDDYSYWLYDATATFLAPLTVIYGIVGPEPLAGPVFVAMLGSVTAAATTKLALELLPVSWAVAAGGAVALLPSQVLFSSLVLKDAAVWALLALLGVVTALAGRSRGARLLVMLVTAGVLLILLTHLRLHTLVVAAWAFALATLFSARTGRTPRVAGAISLLLVVPLWAGAGLAGIGLVSDQQGTLERKRLANGQGAATAFVPLPAPTGAAPGSQQPDEVATPTRGDLAGLPRGLQALVLDPLPWSPTPNSRVALARLESAVLWWPLLSLAGIGVVIARRELRVLAFPLLAGGAIVLMYALAEGNFGTAYRHRGEFVWVVALLAAVGAHAIGGRLVGRAARDSGARSHDR